MKILDCTNLNCPEPIILAKKFLQELQPGQEAQILANSKVVKENLKRFLNVCKLEFELKEEEGLFKFYLSLKNPFSLNQESENFDCQIPIESRKKAVFIADESLADPRLGKILLPKMINAFLNIRPLPAYIIFVNKAVYFSTNRSSPVYESLKILEQNGVEILSCGACLEALGLVDSLCVGKISNALEITEILMNYENLRL